MWAAGGAKANSEPAAYRVSQVAAVRSLSEFECRLAGYPHAETVRFRVQIRDVSINPQIPADLAAEYLYERLNNAETIILENVQVRNYFRLTADVRVDGQDVAEELIQQGLALPVALPETPMDAPPVAAPRTARRYPLPVEPPARPSATRPGPPLVTLQSLLDSQVDLSEMNDQTPLQEAFQIMSDSVRPRLPFVILWNDLQTNAFVDKQMPIGVSQFGTVKLKQALKVILHTISRNAPHKVILAMEGQVITIGTQKGLIQKSRVHSYSIDDLVMAPFTEETDDGYGRNN